MFELSSLVELARRPYHHEAYWSNGKVKVNDTWGANGDAKLTLDNRLTSYHMDAECNFLLQVAGNKTLSVYDRTDRTLVSHEQREAYYAGDMNSIAYRESRQADATPYEFLAGQGVHIPVFAPHWVRNHDNISVAVSVNYELRSALRDKRIYQMNRLLRKMGTVPTAPGESPWRDRVKLAAADGLVAARNLMKSKSASDYPVWTPSSI